MKNVVIIGAAIGGATAARNLEKILPASHRIILIDAKDFSYYSPAGLRAAVVPGWEEKTLAPLSNFFPKDSKHIVLPLTKVTSLENGFLTVDKTHSEFELSEKIEFDYCIVATGSAYSAPGRIDTSTREEGVAVLKKMQSDIASSKSILIVGGGVVGVEMAGEIKAAHPSTEVTIVQSASTVIPTFPTTLHASLMPQLTKMGVKVIFDDRVDLPREEMITGPVAKKVVKTVKGASVETDFIFNATGNKFVEYLVTASDPSAVVDGYIKTKKSGKGSLMIVDSEKLKNVLVIGDASDQEPKTAFAINVQAPIVAANIVALIKAPSSLKSFTGLPMNAMAVSLGPKGGSLYGLPLVGVRGSWFTSKLKSGSLMISGFKTTYNWEKATA